LDEKSYAHDCRLYTPENPHSIFFNFKNTLFDEYAIAHAVGYILKAVLVRDLKLLWCISIFFELLEVTFQHWLTNFHEFSLISLILDVGGITSF
jgi:phosphatidylserine synthase 2